ncbi:hypothetical protein QW71_24240 [Paenibacillus sp. IHB B 3415]|nr:hypothetical protein QW71_24240 [Paenibacillus sp. IHB B 3415]
MYESETVSHSVYGKLAVTEAVYEASDPKYFQYTGIYGYDSDGCYTAIKIKITGYDGPGGEVIKLSFKLDIGSFLSTAGVTYNGAELFEDVAKPVSKVLTHEVNLKKIK